MSIAEQIANAFPGALAWGRRADIAENPNLMELPGSPNLTVVVPAYMLWCTDHPHSGELISDFTLAALAEYGRCKSPNNCHLNFRYLCSAQQSEVVVSFLEWASEALSLVNQRGIERALRNWKSATNNPVGTRLA